MLFLLVFEGELVFGDGVGEVVEDLEAAEGAVRDDRDAPLAVHAATGRQPLKRAEQIDVMAVNWAEAEALFGDVERIHPIF